MVGNKLVTKDKTNMDQKVVAMTVTFNRSRTLINTVKHC